MSFLNVPIARPFSIPSAITNSVVFTDAALERLGVVVVLPGEPHLFFLPPLLRVSRRGYPHGVQKYSYWK